MDFRCNIHPTHSIGARHQGIQQPWGTKDVNQQKLTPQQELELIKHIDELSARRIPSTRTMIRNFASSIAKSPVSDSWATRFLNTYQDQLTSQWNNAMDTDRHTADSYTRYQLYFDLLQQRLLNTTLTLSTHTIWMRRAS